MKTAALALTLVSCLLASPVSALADNANGDVAATALFDDGRKLMAQHRYAEACPKFAESQRLAPSGGTLINLAQCYEHTGQTASAWAAWKDAAARASSAGKEDAEKSALHHALALEPSLAKLTIAVDPASEVSGLEVKRDGIVVGHAEFGVAIPVDPGAHVVAASAPGKKALSLPVDVAAKQPDARVTVTLADDPAAIASAASSGAAGAAGATGASTAAATTAGAKDVPNTPPDHAAPSNGSTPRAAGWITAGVGVAGLALGSVFGLVAKSKNDDAIAHDGCKGSTCVGANGSAGAAESSDAKSAATLATVSFIAGGVVLATGLALVLLSPSGQAIHVTPTVGQSYGGVAAFGRW